MTGPLENWKEVRDQTRLWCKIDPERALIEIVHRNIKKFIDLRAYGLMYVGAAALEREQPDAPGELLDSLPPAPATPT